MDVSAIYKGQKGKEKGKGRDKKGKGKSKGKIDDKGEEKDPTANPDAEIICYYYHRKGHRKRDCRAFEKDSKKGVNAVDHAPGLTPGADVAPSGTPSRVSMIELDNWILAVNVEEHEKMVGSIERVMVDSGAPVSVCPLMRGENGTSTVAPVDLGDAVPTSENLSDLLTVEDTIDVAREDAEANVPLAVPSPKQPGASEPGTS